MIWCAGPDSGCFRIGYRPSREYGDPAIPARDAEHGY